MAVRRESRSDKQSSEVKERTAVQNQINSKTGRPENVDSLVSRFLAELTDLSSEMGQAGSNFKLEEQVLSKSDPDLEHIDQEIEASLTELENLKRAPASKDDKPVPDAQAMPPEPAVQTKIQNTFEPAKTESPIDPEEQAWNRIEVFRNTVSTRKDRSLRTWIWAGLVLVVLAGIAAFYFSRSDSSEPKTGQVAASEQKPSDQPPASVEKTPAIPDSTRSTIDLRKESRPIESGRSFQERTRSKAASRSTARNVEKSSNGTSRSSAARPEFRRAEEMRSSAAPERPKTDEEPVRSAPAPVTSAPPPPVPEQPAPVQAKSNPVLPASSAASPPPPAAPVREVAAPAPKPATPPATDSSDTAQPKPVSKPLVMAEVIKKVAPEYPVLARIQKVSGKVEVEAEIDEKGDVVRTKALSGPNVLRLSAEEALKKWKFKPASVDGVSVPSKARISVNFTLQ